VTEQKLITIKAKSASGKVVEFSVLEILEIDGSSQAQFESALRMERVEQRLDALEQHVLGEQTDG
jgi:hypothetical protein